ncbi:hypothetical protein SDC9_200827 [bioreactor metagenome]|uniref:Oxaloacetate decarboxylase gamma chain n=1 Tax=bioreactor metagenome TaxID=1076179 RepID=A0A645J140_9ZZZZ|nr:hypothetical protein [Proteiniphilum sp.]MEA4916335.1 hypothetical protein [Proteiniphilum sp.]
MELLQINWGNAFIIVGIGFGMVMIILAVLVIMLSLWDRLIATLNQKKMEKGTNTLFVSRIFHHNTVRANDKKAI